MVQTDNQTNLSLEDSSKSRTFQGQFSNIRWLIFPTHKKIICTEVFVIIILLKKKSKVHKFLNKPEHCLRKATLTKRSYPTEKLHEIKFIFKLHISQSVVQLIIIITNKNNFQFCKVAWISSEREVSEMDLYCTLMKCFTVNENMTDNFQCTSLSTSGY